MIEKTKIMMEQLSKGQIAREICNLLNIELSDEDLVK